MSNYEKQVIIINGQGGCGKDTLIDFISEKYDVLAISAVDKIKDIAKQIGWKGGKEPKDRKFLADLKNLSDEYNGFTMTYMINQFIAFMSDMDGHNDIMFICLREPEHIRTLCDILNPIIQSKTKGSSVATLLIKRGEQKIYGNASDDDVNNYNYDYIFENNAPLEETKDKFISFVENNILTERN